MPTRELIAKYGDGGSTNSRAAINRAIRAELVGGDHCLVALDALRCLENDWRERGWTDGLAEIRSALADVDEVARMLRAEIRRRYGMPPEK